MFRTCTNREDIHAINSFNNLVPYSTLELVVTLDVARQTWHLTCHKALHVLFAGTYLQYGVRLEFMCYFRDKARGE